MKFLAVLAVLAMAFAAFAVVAPAETDDAAIAGSAAYYDGDGSAEDLNVYLITTSAADGFAADGRYLITGDVEISATAGGSGDAIIYIVSGATLTITTITASTFSSITVVPASVSGAAVTATDTAVKITAATNATFTYTSGDPSSLVIGGTATASAVALSEMNLTVAATFSGPIDVDDYSGIISATTTSATFADFTGSVEVSGGYLMITAGSYTSSTNYTTTSGTLITEGKTITFYEFCGIIGTQAGTATNLTTGFRPTVTGVTAQTTKTFIDEAYAGRMAVAVTEGTVNQFITFDNANGTTIASKATVDIGQYVVLHSTSTEALTVDGKLRVAGTVSMKSDYTTLVNNGTIYLKSADALIPADINGTGTVNTDAIQSTATIGESFSTATTPYSVTQYLKLSSSTVIEDGSIIIVKGTLEVPANITLTIEDGGVLIIADATGKLINNGKIVIESSATTAAAAYTRIDGSSSAELKGGLVINDGCFENNGIVDVDYTADDYSVATYYTDPFTTLNATGTVINNGEIKIKDDSVFYADEVFDNYGTILIRGLMLIDNTATNLVFTNYAAMTINGTFNSVNEDEEIVLGSTDAVIDIIQLVGIDSDGGVDAVLNVTDGSYQVTASGATSETPVESTISVTVAQNTSQEVLTGLKITLEKYKLSDGKTYAMIAMSGDVSADVDDAATDAVDLVVTGDILISGDLYLGENVALTIGNAAESDAMYVTGTFTANAQNSGVDGITLNAANAAPGLTVSGKVSSIKNDITTTLGKINAAYYKIDATAMTNTIYVYTSLATAISDGATAIKLFNSNVLSENVTMPEGVTVTNTTGSTLTINANYTLTVADGATLKNTGANIDVDGTLTAYNYKSTFRAVGTVVADVKIVNEDNVTYTNVSNALTLASAGDTVTIMDDDSVIQPGTDLEIPAGVILDIGDATLFMDDNTILTVNGALYIGSNGVLTLQEAQTSDDVDAVAKLNGLIQKTDGFPSSGYYGTIDGAYYEMTIRGITYGCAVPVTSIPDIAEEADDGQVAVWGDASISTITFPGTSDQTLYVTFHDDLTAASITLDYAMVAFVNSANVDATFTNGVGSIYAKGVAATTFKVYETTDDKLTVTGQFTANTESTTASTLANFVTGGTVYSYGAYPDYIKVAGTLYVTADNATAITYMLVDGDLKVNNKCTLKATTLAVKGTAVAAEKTSSAASGCINVDNLWVGLVAGTTVSDAASVSGKITLNSAAYVLNGASVPESITELPSTDYYVDGALWITAYAVTASTAYVGTAGSPTVTNGVFNYWYTTSATTSVNSSAYIGAVDSVTASISYKIYGVTIIADAGIGAVKIGDLMLIQSAGTNGYNVFTSGENSYVAGTYAVNLQAASGYSIDKVKLQDADGNDLSMKIAFSGTKAPNKNITLYLTGSETIDITPAETPEVQQNEWTITTILLVILVILIAIMAVIVALRLNRS